MRKKAVTFTESELKWTCWVKWKYADFTAFKPYWHNKYSLWNDQDDYYQSPFGKIKKFSKKWWILSCHLYCIITACCERFFCIFYDWWHSNKLTCDDDNYLTCSTLPQATHLTQQIAAWQQSDTNNNHGMFSRA